MRQFSVEMLQKMTKEQLILHVSELYKELDSIPERKASRAGVVTSGSPKYVRTYVSLVKKQLQEEKGRNNA
jgi:hypothetical protein